MVSCCLDSILPFSSVMTDCTFINSPGVKTNIFHMLLDHKTGPVCEKEEFGESCSAFQSWSSEHRMSAPAAF